MTAKIHRASFSLEKEYLSILEIIAENEHRSKTAQLRHMIVTYAEKIGINTEEVLKVDALMPT